MDHLSWRRPALGLIFILIGAVLPFWVAQRITAETTPPRSKMVGPFRPEMVVVPAGRFMMGTSEEELKRLGLAGDSDFEDELYHEVVLSRPFAIARTEVTQDQWSALMGSNPSYFQAFEGSGQRPVERVSWYDAIVYLNKLSKTEGLTPCYSDCRATDDVGTGCPSDDLSCVGAFSCESVKRKPGCDGYRLPTEAEWEYAARAGTKTPTYAGEMSLTEGVNTFELQELNDIAVYIATSSLSGSRIDCNKYLPESLRRQRPGQYPCGTSRVRGERRPNTWGLFDMIGNVWEWVEDGYDDRFFFDASKARGVSSTTTSTTDISG